MSVKEQQKYEAQIHALQISIAMFRCVFSKYESFKANGIKRVSVNEVIKDFTKCEKQDDAAQVLVAALTNRKDK